MAKKTDRFVTYEKMSKKQRKEFDRLKRRDWGGVKPATVTFRDGRGYDRKKLKKELARERDGQAPFLLREAALSSPA